MNVVQYITFSINNKVKKVFPEINTHNKVRVNQMKNQCYMNACREIHTNMKITSREYATPVIRIEIDNYVKDWFGKRGY